MPWRSSTLWRAFPSLLSFRATRGAVSKATRGWQSLAYAAYLCLDVLRAETGNGTSIVLVPLTAFISDEPPDHAQGPMLISCGGPVTFQELSCD